MPSVPLHPLNEHRNGHFGVVTNPLPSLLQTPCGLALLEIQGTLHTPTPNATRDSAAFQTPVGRLIFPNYDPDSTAASNLSWMKRVYLYVGKHQRMTGEVKRLPKAIAVLQKREKHVENTMELDGQDPPPNGDGAVAEELEVVEIIKYKILFASRPEPVGD